MFIASCSDKTPASVLFTGDLLLAKGTECAIQEYGPDYPFAQLDAEFKRHTIVCGNLESVITGRGVEYEDKLYTFRLNPSNAAYLERRRINLFTLANNHILDYGPDGMRETLALCAYWKIPYCGAGETIDDAFRPAYLKAGSVHILFFSMCERPPEDFFAQKDRPGTASLDIERIKIEIGRYRKKDDLVVVSLHWGEELEQDIDQERIDKAHALVDAGVDAVIGHHPHIPQGIEIYKGRPIFYSLGNTICGFYNSAYTDNILAVLRIEGRKIVAAEVIPIAGDNVKIYFSPYILTGQDATREIERMRVLSSRFNTDIKEVNGRGIISL